MVQSVFESPSCDRYLPRCRASASSRPFLLPLRRVPAQEGRPARGAVTTPPGREPIRDNGDDLVERAGRGIAGAPRVQQTVRVVRALRGGPAQGGKLDVPMPMPGNNSRIALPEN